jgi:hypothetical protein
MEGIRGAFQLLVAGGDLDCLYESQRDDILQARSSLMMRSPGWLGWDPVSERPAFACVPGITGFSG